MMSASASARAAPSPRLRQPWSPRHPSPLGLPPMGFSPLPPHVAFQPLQTYPITPERFVHPKGASSEAAAKVPYPPEARRPQAGAQHPRPRSHAVPPPLSLNSADHPPTMRHMDMDMDMQMQRQLPATAQPVLMPDMHVSPPSPTPSETDSLSLYSADSVHKNFPIDVVVQDRQQEEEEEEKPPALFCGCFNFKAWFGSKSKAREKKILGPPAPPAPAPQMVQVRVQTRRRPPPLNM